MPRAKCTTPCQKLAQALSGSDVERGPGWIVFDTEVASVLASSVQGVARLRIRAYLGPGSAGEAERWVQRQPSPQSGLLELAEEDGVIQPRLVFERAVSGNDWSGDPLRQEISAYAMAWGNDDVASPAKVEGAYQVGDDPRDLVPASAWLLFGDNASFPDSEEMATAQEHARVGIFDYLWTSAKQTEVGDLVLLYFTGTRKAAHFVARAASNAFFSVEIDVNADTAVSAQQWWVFLTPPVEIDAITFAVLRAATDNHLILRGRSGSSCIPRL